MSGVAPGSLLTVPWVPGVVVCSTPVHVVVLMGVGPVGVPALADVAFLSTGHGPSIGSTCTGVAGEVPNTFRYITIFPFLFGIVSVAPRLRTPPLPGRVRTVRVVSYLRVLRAGPALAANATGSSVEKSGWLEFQSLSFVAEGIVNERLDAAWREVDFG